MAKSKTSEKPTNATGAGEGFRLIPITLVEPSAENPRTRYDEKADADILASIREKGVLVPVLCRPKGDKFELVCGHRRLKAATEAGLAEIPAIVRPMTDQEAMETAAIENLQRADLHPLDEAKAYNALLARHGLEPRLLATKIGKPINHVVSRLALNNLHDSAKKLFTGGGFGLGVALKICRISTPEGQAKAAAEIAKRDITEAAAWRHIQQNYMLLLSEAQFSLKDTNLVPDAGACMKCAKASLNQPALFDEGIKKKDALCTDAKCYAAKQGAYGKNMTREWESMGRRALTATEAKSSFHSHGGMAHDSAFTRLSDTDYRDPQNRTYMELLGPDAEADIILVVNPYNGLVEMLFEKSKLNAAMKAAGHDFGAKRPTSSSGEKERKRQEKIEKEVKARTVEALVTTLVEEKDSHKRERFLLCLALEKMQTKELRQYASSIGINYPDDKKNYEIEEDLRRATMTDALENEKMPFGLPIEGEETIFRVFSQEVFFTGWKDASATLDLLCKQFGINTTVIRAEVEKSLTPAPKKEKKKVKEQPEKPTEKPTGKKKKGKAAPADTVGDEA